ncbi:MAG: 30S ribosomal protein S27ae [Candidatus Aenigmatarchaeota archaeon]
MGKKKGKKERKGKKPRSKSKHRKSQKWKKYKDGKPQGKFCPRCGPGVFVGVHKDRVACGKCGYAEVQKK